jgi:hypothetical protein
MVRLGSYEEVVLHLHTVIRTASSQPRTHAFTEKQTSCHSELHTSKVHPETDPRACTEGVKCCRSVRGEFLSLKETGRVETRS